MDAFKGIHAIATTCTLLLLTFVTYNFFESFFNAVTYNLFKYILWTSYVLIIIVCTLVVPATIAFSNDSDTSIISSLAALGMYALGAMAMRIGTPFAQYFVGEGYDGVFSTVTDLTVSQASQATQWISFLWIVAALMFLFIGPITMGLIPSMYESMIKKVTQ